MNITRMRKKQDVEHAADTNRRCEFDSQVPGPIPRIPFVSPPKKGQPPTKSVADPSRASDMEGPLFAPIPPREVAISGKASGKKRAATPQLTKGMSTPEGTTTAIVRVEVGLSPRPETQKGFCGYLTTSSYPPPLMSAEPWPPSWRQSQLWPTSICWLGASPRQWPEWG